MLRFLALRFFGLVVTLLIIGLLTFALFYWLPTDPAKLSCGKPCQPDTLHQIRTTMGLDRSVFVQYLEFLKGIFVGRTYGSGPAAIHCHAPCLGYSFKQSRTVTSLITDRFPVTASIAVGAAILWLIVGVSSGLVSALKRGTVVDRAAMIAALAGVSAPTYLVGLLGIFLFGFKLNMVPVNGYANLDDGIVQWAWHLVLPWCTLAFVSAAIYARLTRGQMLDVLEEDYITTARAKGLRESRVVLGHGLRAALTPIITLFGLDLGSLLGGAVITESVFSMPGLGQQLVQSVQGFDLPVIVGITMFTAALVIVANVLVDILHAALDPRVTVD